MSDSATDDILPGQEDLLNFLYACPVGLIEFSDTGAIGLMNPVAMQWLLPIAEIPFSSNFFAIMEIYAPELRIMAEAFGAEQGMVCENHRIFIGARAATDDFKVMTCTLVKLSRDRFIATIADISGQVAQERRLKTAEAALLGAEAALASAQERERIDHALGLQAARFGTALGTMSQGLCMFDAAGTLIVANDRLAELFGMEHKRVSLGATMEIFLAQAAEESTLKKADVDWLCDNIFQLKAVGRHATLLRTLTDDRTLAMNFSPMDGDGWLVTLEDITERKVAEARITYMALHDSLTGLPNRVKFHQRLSEAVARNRRGEPAAVLCLDLDRFKAVNDMFGHPVGDALLMEVSKRLRATIREIDTAARLGGDEFAVVQSGGDQPKHAVTLAKRLIETLSVPYEINGHEVTIGTSVGIAVLPDDGQDADQLLDKADIALYCAKTDGGGGYRFFEPAMNERMQVRRTLEIDLRAALKRGEFEVYYQPLVSIKTDSVSGFEALLRWNHPKRGLVQPTEFITMAEEIGLIIPMGKWVLRQACADAVTWPEHVKVAVNVSVIQFGSPTLVADVTAALEASGLNPKRLEIEITETTMLDDTDAILAILHQIKALGVGIAMDDFGTGYSSLNYLRRFPFSKVKIDRSFIRTLGTGSECDAIVGAITDLCETLGMTTVAEGVETDGQLQYLRTGHCGQAQGYLFSKPRPAAEVASMLRMLAADVPTMAVS